MLVQPFAQDLDRMAREANAIPLAASRIVILERCVRPVSLVSRMKRSDASDSALVSDSILID